jgi:hypothetical protein
MKPSWADIDEEERLKEEKVYVPPHKKEPKKEKTLPRPPQSNLSSTQARTLNL